MSLAPEGKSGMFCTKLHTLPNQRDRRMITVIRRVLALITIVLISYGTYRFYCDLSAERSLIETIATYGTRPPQHLEPEILRWDELSRRHIGSPPPAFDLQAARIGLLYALQHSDRSMNVISEGASLERASLGACVLVLEVAPALMLERRSLAAESHALADQDYLALETLLGLTLEGLEAKPTDAPAGSIEAWRAEALAILGMIRLFLRDDVNARDRLARSRRLAMDTRNDELHLAAVSLLKAMDTQRTLGTDDLEFLEARRMLASIHRRRWFGWGERPSPLMNIARVAEREPAYCLWGMYLRARMLRMYVGVERFHTEIEKDTRLVWNRSRIEPSRP